MGGFCLKQSSNALQEPKLQKKSWCTIRFLLSHTPSAHGITWSRYFTLSHGRPGSFWAVCGLYLEQRWQDEACIGPGSFSFSSLNGGHLSEGKASTTIAKQNLADTCHSNSFLSPWVLIDSLKYKCNQTTNDYKAADTQLTKQEQAKELLKRVQIQISIYLAYRSWWKSLSLGDMTPQQGNCYILASLFPGTSSYLAIQATVCPT